MKGTGMNQPVSGQDMLLRHLMLQPELSRFQVLRNFAGVLG